jgi:site-specific recombinase XerD
LKEAGHNEEGKHAKYQAVKVFLLWYEREFEPENWKNPICKVKAPKVSDRIVEIITRDEVQALLATCDQNLNGIRDNAYIKFLFQSNGARLYQRL